MNSFAYKVCYVWLVVGALLSGTTGCNSAKQKASPTVTITDPDLESDICAAVYHYAETVTELGRGQFRINGHLWKSYSPLIPDGYELVTEFSPKQYSNKMDLFELIGQRNNENLMFWINIDDQEPAPKLFLVMDVAKELAATHWIDTSKVNGGNSVRIFAPLLK